MNMDTTTPAGFASFFKNHATAQDALSRAATSGQQLSANISNVAGISNKMTQDALSYGTQERQDAAAGSAMAEVRMAIGRNEQANQRKMASMGVRPDSGRFQGDNSASVIGALAEVSAGNTARRQEEELGQTRLKEALGASSSAASMGLALDGSVIDSAYKTELSDRQNALNAAQLSLNKYSVDKGIQYNNQKLQAQSDAANGQMWGNALNLGLSVLKDTGALSGAVDAIKNWWNS